MACQCAERRAAIVQAVKSPTTSLTAARFVAKSLGSDAKQLVIKLQRRPK